MQNQNGLTPPSELVFTLPYPEWTFAFIVLAALVAAIVLMVDYTEPPRRRW